MSHPWALFWLNAIPFAIAFIILWAGQRGSFKPGPHLSWRGNLWRFRFETGQLWTRRRIQKLFRNRR